jgi:hypothetical protein
VAKSSVAHHFGKPKALGSRSPYGHFLAKPYGANEVIEEISALMRQADAR